ncbi:DeoR family transcriptional regulator [Lichenihabitans sp. Uapishka_5]|uniref:DeoR family transcriptional regulator n=1 Tax=Lichenihabitans sp. Uapishka_5 TaxID=3037302 RepID=UPI0029E7FE18|nr:DeoR family transcriptional regulator [Lichenihabitans sp. Uapishka_5]MDX7951039.1 DeoR family transcriptional regulator [Lichenihabitans sp. Uapishka_5]
MTAARHATRVNALADALAASAPLHLRDAAQLLGVSEMTIRRDIEKVPDRFGYLGGYIVPRAGDAPYVMAQEQGAHEAAKAAIAGRAAALIEADDTVFIDCGTTTPHLVRALPDRPMTVVCYALNVAAPLAARPNVRLILLGGLYNPSSASFAVEDGLATLARLGINKAFLSAGGVHAERGVSCSNFHEVAVKQAVLRLSERRCLLVDGSKLGKLRPAFFAGLDGFDTLITNEGAGLSALRPAFSGTIITDR